MSQKIISYIQRMMRMNLVIVLIVLSACTPIKKKNPGRTRAGAREVAAKKYDSLTDAVIASDITAVQNFLQAGANVHEKIKNEGWTPLHYAAHQGDLQIEELLRMYGADVNELSKTPEDSAYRDTATSPLHAAVMGGSLPMVISLINARVYEVAGGIKERLISRGARSHINERDGDGNTLLHLAIMHGHVDIAYYLLSLGACITDHINDHNDYKIGGDTPLTLAFKKGDKPFITELLNHGADINETHEEYITLLMDAVHTESLDDVQYLLSHGARVDISDAGGRTALHYAARTGNVAIAKILLEHGAELDENAFGGGGLLSFCGSPLMVAAQEGHVDMVAFLLAQGADIAVRDTFNGETVIDRARERGDVPLIALLTVDKSSNG